MMTSSRIALTLALAALPAATALAQTATQDVNISAVVPRYCKFDSAPTFGSRSNVNLGSAGIASSVLTIATPTNSTGIMNAASFNFSIPSTCNFPSQVTFTTVKGGLKDDTPEPIVQGTFLNRMDYRVSLFDWNGVGPFELTTNGTAMSSATGSGNSAHVGNLQGSVIFQVNNSAPLAAGDYSDILRISLSPL